MRRKFERKEMAAMPRRQTSKNNEENRNAIPSGRADEVAGRAEGAYRERDEGVEGVEGEGVL